MPHFSLERCHLCSDDCGPSRGRDRKPVAIARIANVRVCAKHLETLMTIASENGVSVTSYLPSRVA